MVGVIHALYCSVDISLSIHSSWSLYISNGPRTRKLTCPNKNSIKVYPSTFGVVLKLFLLLLMWEREAECESHKELDARREYIYGFTLDV